MVPPQLWGSDLRFALARHLDRDALRRRHVGNARRGATTGLAFGIYTDFHRQKLATTTDCVSNGAKVNYAHSAVLWKLR
jgi:hypothetical protein